MVKFVLNNFKTAIDYENHNREVLKIQFFCHSEAKRRISQLIANTKLEIPHFVSE